MFLIFSAILIWSCTQETPLTSNSLNENTTTRSISSGAIHNNYVNYLNANSTTKLEAKTLFESDINTSSLSTEEKAYLISTINTIEEEVEDILLTSQLLTYIDGIVNTSDASSTAKGILLELYHSDLSTVGIEPTFIAQANQLTDTDEKEIILHTIDITFRSYELWTNYVQTNSYVNYIGGGTNPTASISVWADFDSAVFFQLASSLVWGDWREREKLQEAAARASQFAKWFTGT